MCLCLFEQELSLYLVKMRLQALVLMFFCLTHPKGEVNNHEGWKQYREVIVC